MGLILKDPVIVYDISKAIEKIKNLPVKYLEWINNRFGKNAEATELHPLSDCVPVLQSYSELEQSILTKYSNNQKFKEKVIEKVSKPLENIEELSSDDMDNVINIYRTIDLSITADSIKKLTTLPMNDKIGEVGDWEIWLPSSRENSCAIARVDKKLDPKTTWCTARTKGSNLFYNYIGGSSGKFILFYVIKKEPKETEDWLSVGFGNGKPILNAQNGGASVDRANIGLTEERLRSILSDKNYNAIINIMKEKCEELNNESPAYTLVKDASQDLNKFKQMIGENTEEEAIDLCIKILEDFPVPKEILLEMVNIVK